MEQRPRRFVHNVPAARALRRPQTRTEEILWESIRDRRLGGWKFRRQHAVGRFVLDFYCHELRLAVEVDGSAHDSAAQRSADELRQAELEQHGVRFLRIQARDIENALSETLEHLLSHIALLPR